MSCLIKKETDIIKSIPQPVIKQIYGPMYSSKVDIQYVLVELKTKYKKSLVIVRVQKEIINNKWIINQQN